MATAEEIFQNRAADRLDLVRRLFGVAISVGVSSAIINADWVDERRMPNAGSDLEQIIIVCLALFATVLSWDGYLMSVKTKHLNDWRFTIDVALVFTYMFLIVTSDTSSFWLPIIVVIYLLYVLWDGLTVLQYPEMYDRPGQDTLRPLLPTLWRVYWRGLFGRTDVDRGPAISLSWAFYFGALLVIKLYANLGEFSSLAFAFVGLFFYRYEKRRKVDDVRGLPTLLRMTLIAMLLFGAAAYACYSGRVPVA